MSLYYYNYGINEIREHQSNNNLLEVHFGNFNQPLLILKSNIIDFINAVIPKEEREKNKITVEKINRNMELNGVYILNFLLKGRALIVIHGSNNFSEYDILAQTGKILITSLNIYGTIEWDSAFNYTAPSFEYLSQGKKINASQTPGAKGNTDGR